jgi:5-methyltetrahydrofolate--homocysteine methyltransferase
MGTKEIFEAVLAFEEAKVKELVQKEVSGGTDLQSILNDGLISAMDEVGRRFAEGDLFVPEMLFAAQAMKGGLEVLKPLLSDKTSHSKGTVIIGTVKGDLHDIGKNLVAMMMEGCGFTVIDLGVDVEAGKFISAAQQEKADVIGLSALLTTTMPAMKATIRAVRETGLNVKTIVGGAPVTEAYAKQIGADGYSPDAPGATALVRRLIAG